MYESWLWVPDVKAWKIIFGWKMDGKAQAHKIWQLCSNFVQSRRRHYVLVSWPSLAVTWRKKTCIVFYWVSQNLIQTILRSRNTKLVEKNKHEMTGAFKEENRAGL